MNCTHRKIQSWDTTDGEPVDFWSCADCGRRFEPLQIAAQPVQELVAKDAARYQWLASRFTGYDFYFGGNPMAKTEAGRGCVIAAFEVGQDFRCSGDITKSIDKAIEAAHGIGEKK